MVLKTKGLSFILITLLAAGCGGSVELPDAEEAAPAPLGEAFELRLDQTQQVEELSIRFVDVTEDIVRAKAADDVGAVEQFA